MYGMTKSVNLFAVELTYWLVNEEGFKKYQFQMSIYLKYAPDETKHFVLSYVDDFLLVYV